MKKHISVFFAAITFFVIMISYQNCGTEGTGALFQKSTSYGLPYETKVNQLAYMSCSEQLDVPNDDGVFFTFRLGAHGADAGLRLSEKFVYETRRKDNHDKLGILADDAPTSLTRLQFSMRQRSNLQRMYKNPDSGEGTEEFDFDFIFGDFGTDAMSASLIKQAPGSYLNYWSAGGITKDAYFEGTLVFNYAEVRSEEVRQMLTRDWVLALGYGNATDPATIRTPLDYMEDDEDDSEISSNQAYGVGLRVSFKQPDPTNWQYMGVPHVNLPKRVLATVTDYDLSLPDTVSGQWTCPSRLQFRIVNNGLDAAERDWDDDDPGLAGVQALCPIGNDPANPSEDLKMVRRSLPASDWYINMARQCIVPRRYTLGSCYGLDKGVTPQVTRTPVYDITKSCNPAINPACSHFVSICYRLP